ncbi:UDP-N-acetylmuramoyl-tripeptide--D-alanyl-D-alanine ligase [Maledivibacter halophilus]|uniref:UDP-N-acetylmuramyl pentapeptide synthase n=1 Tax=Maledivibacter halophilus TaxID=36842 RepID=A0A1T5IWB3_9FIRM|nr:hypothetical protein [Maledivibacter halophilus]SKC43233.1 UDP-N-acetylmuramyl pentapeptide synthase [Maledivibacter halophilus]
MSIVKVIGIVTDHRNTMISNLVFILLKQIGYNVALINDSLIKINEHVVEKKSINDNSIKKFFVEEEKIDYIILDNFQIEKLYKLIGEFKIDALIDDQRNDKNKLDKEICAIKKGLLNKLRRNGTCIINSENRALNNYFDSLQDKIIITYGLESKSTITASSLDIDEIISFNCCIQRGLTTLRGNEIEQMEFPIKIRYYDDFNIYDFLALIGIALIYEIPVESIRQIIYRVDTKNFD